MRRTNKKVMRKADDKKGVILVTVLFIIAMALLFITTALTISIASRQRVYSNAKSDQARLTVTSLAQSIWQAIYSQQINDVMLNNLADGTSGNGSYVTFSTDSVPGMGTAGTEASAYFYRDDDNPKNIIECKCSIEGRSQYYRMVLIQNPSEGLPSPCFNMQVELGNPGMLNAFNFGVDASQIVFSNHKPWQLQTQYRVNPDGTPVTDNVVFFHGGEAGTFSDQGGSGFYCDVITDGRLYARDSVFTSNLYMVGENAIFDFTSTSQTGVATNDAGRADAYFWGTSLPFMGAQASTSMPTFDDIYFLYRNTGDALNSTTTGFNAVIPGSGGTTYARDSGANNTYYLRGYNADHPWGIGGTVHFSRQDSSNNVNAYLADAITDGHPSITGWSFAGSSDKVPSNISGYFTPETSIIDTVSEVTDSEDGYGKYEDHDGDDGEIEAVEITATTTSIAYNKITDADGERRASGYFVINGLDLNNHVINVNISKGSMVIYVRGDINIGGSTNSGFFITGGDDDHNCIFVLESGRIVITSRTMTEAIGLVDPRCFNGDPVYPQNIDQTTTPRFFVFAGYTGGSAMQLGDTGTNGGVVCTAFLGFYPSTPGGSDGCGLELHNVAAGTDRGGGGIVYYGRIACGSLGNANDNGGNLNVPYCPEVPGSRPPRNSAYRDNTDYSVVTDECGYFTA